jgi:hypothetical protein
MSNIFTNLQSEQAKQQATLREPFLDQSPKPKNIKKTLQKVTQEPTRSRDTSRDPAREKSRDLPTRDDIQLFSFQLRDELRAKAKIQAEVPPQWQEELDGLAQHLNVKKLELYRYIIGAFLGKTERGRGDRQ